MRKELDLEMTNDLIEKKTLNNVSDNISEEKNEQIMSDEEIDAEINALLDVPDEEIINSLKLAEKEERRAGRKKLASTVQADNLISNFLQSRSEDDWKALQDFFWYGIKQYAYGFVKNNDDAYDMTIETFINAYKNIDSYEPNKAKFSTWLWTICRNNCLGFKKRGARLNIVDNDVSEIYDSELYTAAARRNSYTQNISEFENGVFAGAEYHATDFSNVTKDLYEISIMEMANIQGIGGQILHMKLVDNMKIREIAVKLSMNESTVKNYLYRGKENLKRILSINHKDLVDTYNDMKEAIDIA